MSDTKLRKIARILRKNQTLAEGVLWSRLRSRQISGCKFRRQHPIDQYILDFYSSEINLAIEVDGGQHSDDKHQRMDDARTDYLETRGIRVIRFWNDEVLNNLDDVLMEIDAVIIEILAEKAK
jgi:very-short-patch-repair endonuclease